MTKGGSLMYKEHVLQNKTKKKSQEVRNLIYFLLLDIDVPMQQRYNIIIEVKKLRQIIIS